jgi:ribosomal-protein-alanine N-acetyltransferase
MKIRRFERSNLGDIVKIESASFSDPWSQKMFLALHEINPRGFYVAKLDDRIIAYAIILLEPYIDKTSLRRRGHLINLAVAPQHRKQGIASTLIARVQKDLKKNKANLILLEVRRSNKAAMDFYSKLMFKRIGSVKGFYKDEDAIVMSKEL